MKYKDTDFTNFILFFLFLFFSEWKYREMIIFQKKTYRIVCSTYRTYRWCASSWSSPSLSALVVGLSRAHDTDCDEHGPRAHTTCDPKTERRSCGERALISLSPISLPVYKTHCCECECECVCDVESWGPNDGWYWFLREESEWKGHHVKTVRGQFFPAVASIKRFKWRPVPSIHPSVPSLSCTINMSRTSCTY